MVEELIYLAFALTVKIQKKGEIKQGSHEGQHLLVLSLLLNFSQNRRSRYNIALLKIVNLTIHQCVAVRSGNSNDR